MCYVFEHNIISVINSSKALCDFDAFRSDLDPVLAVGDVTAVLLEGAEQVEDVKLQVLVSLFLSLEGRLLSSAIVPVCCHSSSGRERALWLDRYSRQET